MALPDSRFIGVGVGIGIGIDSPDATVSGCAMNLLSRFAHMQKAHVCATQRCPFDSDPDAESCDIHAGSGQ
jgi:hypothetical protein